MWDGSSLICYDDLTLDKEVMELTPTEKSHPNLDISEDEIRGTLNTTDVDSEEALKQVLENNPGLRTKSKHSSFHTLNVSHTTQGFGSSTHQYYPGLGD